MCALPTAVHTVHQCLLTQAWLTTIIYHTNSASAKRGGWLLILEKKKEAKTHTPTCISGAEVERVNSYRFMGNNITDNYGHLTTPPWWEKQREVFWSQVQVNFYREAIESISSGNISGLHGFCSAQDRRALLQVIKTSQNINHPQIHYIFWGSLSLIIAICQ